ncbi:S49 family peptidase [Roseomonas sp. SSH11]|uniref:S49 family peptidase n=1 Tax=Pararoseomonas baculiformis TaxID=2820812 RepID=A0ABS4AAS7_9PROT|nr:S49 family peptidase [Pararoseomonas baculiformis]MBP0444106.1 S49 family peptidase [Pararoseomonas baculiformis]
MKLPFLDHSPRVAVVRLQGVIAPRANGLAGPTLSAAALDPVLERAFGLKRLAAVMLAVNSPGGSPAQSSLIAARIRQLAERKKVPVIACVEDAAASGGYWLACAADEIIADPASIIGSVGVISAGFGFEEAIARLGIERRLVTAGEDKSFLDPFRPVDPAQQERLRDLMEALHQEFITWVEARRGTRLRPEGEPLFTGRFWTGRRALELGLVDGLGDLRGEVNRRFGEKARIIPLGARRPRLPWRLLSGASLDPAAAVDGALAAAEARATWGRIGL